MIAIFEIIIFLTRIAFVFVVVRRVRRRRRPPSVLRPVRPSVAVVRRRRPLSVRPSVRPVRPSPSVVVNLQIQGRMQIFEKTSKYHSYSLGTRGIG